MVANGQSAEENQVSSTSGSWVQPAGGSSSGPRQASSPDGEYQTGIRCPHHSCRLMHQSCRLSTQPKYRPANSGGLTCTRPSRTAAPAASASGPTRTYHCSDSLGSIGSPDRSECPTECRYGRRSAP